MRLWKKRHLSTCSCISVREFWVAKKHGVFRRYVLKMAWSGHQDNLQQQAWSQGTSSSKIPTGSARPWPASLGEGGVLESESSMHNVLDGARRGKRFSSTSCLTGMGTKVWVGAWPSARRSASSSGVALLGSGVVGGAGAGLSCLRKASLAFMLDMICLQESAKRSPRGHLILLTLHSFSLGGR